MATVGKLIFGKDDFQFGLELCLSRAGMKAYRVNEKNAMCCDVLLVSVFWYRNLYDIEIFYRKSGIKKAMKNGLKRPKIFIGGMQATMTPEAFAEYGDWVFIGDAEDEFPKVIKEIIEGAEPTSKHIFRSGDSVIPEPCVCKPTAFVFNKGGKAGANRIEIARGCKYKCAFCCLSELKPYIEVPLEDIIHATEKIPNRKTVNFFAPEVHIYSRYAELQEYIKLKQFRNMSGDVRLNNLSTFDRRSGMVGVEGLSEKLRKSIGKPFSDEYILDALKAWQSIHGTVCTLGMYFIADLPGETKEDWAIFYDFLKKVEVEDFSRFMNFRFALNPLSPKRFTRLVEATVHPLRNYDVMWRDIQRKGGSGQWGFRIKESIVWPPTDRVMDVIVQRGGKLSRIFAESLKNSVLKGRMPRTGNDLSAIHMLDAANAIGITDEAMNIDRSTVIPDA